jgi:hypothetical protein
MMELFRDIEVVPATGADIDGIIPVGGPRWPDFDAQVAVRHCRAGKPVDKAPPEWDGAWVDMERPVVWGGLLHELFGHLVTEMTTRLPVSMEERPNDLYLFGVRPGVTKEAIAPHVQPVLDWYGVRADQWDIPKTGLRVAELRVEQQGEQLYGPAATPEFQEKLDGIAARNGIEGRAYPLLYVTRAGMIERCSGAHAGESYLVEVLQKLGVPVLDPATAPLKEQVEAYAGAETMVFAEGSALHGRQLLGWRDQTIVVLNRRPGAKTAHTNLYRRVPHLRYVEAVRHILATVRFDGAVRFQRGLAFMVLPKVFRTFADLGVDVEGAWDMAAYQRARRRDLMEWATQMRRFRPTMDVEATRARLEATLAEAEMAGQIPAVVGRICDEA